MPLATIAGGIFLPARAKLRQQPKRFGIQGYVQL
jgi:hypothetical protein